ncbi:uncharacterized protein LOC113464288, partial [Ceratina calcarata]|uniref:Uncharacterized protein LOC113464288 n=1 Tax=Ceratina calcarata TaxID=156304 RepID=A0AAJ7WAD5_9HYME
MPASINNPNDANGKNDDAELSHADTDSIKSYATNETNFREKTIDALNNVTKALEGMTTAQNDMKVIFIKGITTIVDKLNEHSSHTSSDHDPRSTKCGNETNATTSTANSADAGTSDTAVGVGRHELIELIQNEIKRVGINPNSNENTPKTSGSDVVKELSEKIRVELVGKDSNKREYKLTSQTKFEHFMDFLTSELRILDLLYIINSDVKPNFTVDDATREKHVFKVRDILINRLDQNYYSKIDKIKDPVEILNKIREIKRCESNLTSMTIRKRLYNMEYVPSKEKAAEFWDRFEELVRNYDSLPNVNPLSHDEKRDAFFNAITPAIPQVQSVEFMTTNSTGKGLTYDQLKAFIIQHEANRAQTSDTKPTALNVKRHDPKNRCYGCGAQGHHKDECPNDNQPKCYECGNIGHIARECSVRLAKQNEQGPTSKFSSSSRQHPRNNSHRTGNRGSFRGKRKFSGASRENHAKRAKISEKGQGGQQKYKDKRNRDDSKENQSGNKLNKGNGSEVNMINCSITSEGNSLTNANDVENTFTRFLADSGATEHLTNSKLIFKTFDETKRSSIRCANKEAHADLSSEGAGTVNVKLSNDRVMNLENVICAEALSENLLSLRKFADMGLSIYLDNREIDIFDPISHESFIKGIYQQPYWIVELELDETSSKGQRLSESRTLKTVAYLTTESSDGEPRYMTRSKTKTIDRSQIDADPTSIDAGIEKKSDATETN